MNDDKEYFFTDVSIENELTDREKWFSAGYCLDIASYLLMPVVNWISCYKRYYTITEKDYELFTADRERFYAAFSKELGQKSDCFTERFIGSQALRDYDGRRDFQRCYPSDGNPFRHYLYYGGILFARIVWKHREIYVPPISGQRTDESNIFRDIREQCLPLYDDDGRFLCRYLHINKEKYEHF